MWWPFSSSTTTIAAPAESAQRAQITPTSVPLREARNQCYAAKDAYFACLDAASILTPGHEGKNDGCLELKKTYEERCQKSWVHYFNTRRVLEEEQREILATQRAQEAAYKRR